MRLVLFTLTLLLMAPALVNADAMPGCDDGEHLEFNPVQPDSPHHAGGRCVSDGGCAVGYARPSAPALVFVCVVLAGAAIRLRRP